MTSFRVGRREKESSSYPGKGARHERLSAAFVLGLKPMRSNLIRLSGTVGFSTGYPAQRGWVKDVTVFLLKKWRAGTLDTGRVLRSHGECRSYPGVELASGAQGSEVDGEDRGMPKFYTKWCKGKTVNLQRMAL